MKLTNLQFNLFIYNCSKYLELHPYCRAGQAMINQLFNDYPDLAKEIEGSENDPFYDDKKILKFLTFIKGE